MNKIKFEGFMNRYSLGGEIESVMLRSSDENISVKMISDDKTLLGEVTVVESEFPNGEFGVYTTSKLKGLLGVLDTSMEVKETTGALRFSDKNTVIQYMVANPQVIPAVPDLKNVPEFDIEITADDDFVNRFIKSTGALAETDTFTFMYKNGKGQIVLGYSTQNTDRISMNVLCTTEHDVVEPISFSAKYLKAILLSNKGSNKSSIRIATKGLCRATFSNGEYTSDYYLVQIAN